MRRSNQFDPDAYGDPPRRRAGGCSPLTMFLIFGLLVFVMMQFRNSANRRQTEPRPLPSNGESNIPDGQSGNARIDENLPRADKHDWSIEEVDTAKSKTPSDGLLNEKLPNAGDPADTRNDPSPTVNERTDRGDWSIEEVDSKRPDPAKPKSTKKGDWEIEEVAE